MIIVISSEYKGLKNVTVNGCVWTHWNFYKINVTDTSAEGTANKLSAISAYKVRSVDSGH
jgi:hypothetical protein